MRKAFSLSRLALLAGILMCLAARPVYADCTTPAAKESAIVYNGDYHTYQFCNGTQWLPYGGGSNCVASGSYSPTTPSGSGYFVLTSTTYNGNLGGLLGADALCLTELTGNTAWKGYATANANGQLIAGKVHAALCIGGCNNLIPLATYSFAKVGDASAGGATFTADSKGVGPNDSANWGAANYFSGTYNYWQGKGDNAGCAGGSTAWCPFINSQTGSCIGWSSSSSGAVGGFGNSSNTTALRWSGTTSTCNNSLQLICFVNP